MPNKEPIAFQENLIFCDNKKCSFVIKNDTGDPNADILPYLNMPCPMCGENLLTEHDYLLSLKTMKIINWMNKWFSWLSIFGKSKNVYSVHIHGNVNIKKL